MFLPRFYIKKSFRSCHNRKFKHRWKWIHLHLFFQRTISSLVILKCFTGMWRTQQQNGMNEKRKTWTYCQSCGVLDLESYMCIEYWVCQWISTLLSTNNQKHVVVHARKIVKIKQNKIKQCLCARHMDIESFYSKKKHTLKLNKK